MTELHIERLIALVAFLGTYLGLALGRLPFFRVDRTGVAIIGGAIVVVTGGLPRGRGGAAVGAHNPVLLFGLMIVSGHPRPPRLFRPRTHAAAGRAPTPP